MSSLVIVIVIVIVTPLWNCSILYLLKEPSCGAGFQPANSQCVGKLLCRQDAVVHSRTKASDDTGYTPSSHSTFDYEYDNAHEHDRTIPVDSQ